MPTLTEKTRNYEFLITPANGDRSFEEVTVNAASGELRGGAVLGGPVAGEYLAYDEAATDGSEVVAAILLEAVADGETVQRGVIETDATVKAYKLSYTGTEATVVAGLNALGIKTR